MDKTHEYWDCEGRPVRVPVDKTKKIERYAGNGAWEEDASQVHPNARGMDISSDYSKINDPDELAEIMKAHDK